MESTETGARNNDWLCLSLGKWGGVLAQTQSASDANSEKESLFKFSGGKHILSHVGAECNCSVFSNLVQIPACDTVIGHVFTDAKHTDTCCCVDLSVWYVCVGSICAFDVTFDDNSISALCAICQIPPGWSESDGADPGTFHFTYSGVDCSGAILDNGPRLHFKFCGVNNSTSIGYTITAYSCSSSPDGPCTKGAIICAPHFVSKVSCKPGSAVEQNLQTTTFSVHDGFPNPSNKTIQFNFSTPFEQVLTLHLVDVVGHEIETVNRITNRGSQKVALNVANLRRGTYYCIFEIGDLKVTRKVLVEH